MTDANNIDDWEYSPQFYDDSQLEKKISLEDFIFDEDIPDTNINTVKDDLLTRTVKDVKSIRQLYNCGKTIANISEELNLDPEYVHNIMVTLSSLSEDDTDMAVARLLI